VLTRELADIGARLKAEREHAAISQRELARRLGVSASLISQIENDQTRPSVGTLYAIVSELGISLDPLFLDDPATGDVLAAGSQGPSPVVREGERHIIELDSGVRWERLTSHQHEDVDFMHVVYDVGGSSAAETTLMRHPGREYGVVLSGRLGVQLAFDRHELEPGDSIAFDSTLPHRFWNLGEEPVNGIWCVVGRDG
jgi:transcriptional regulator with XRE-family HTH domain